MDRMTRSVRVLAIAATVLVGVGCGGKASQSADGGGGDRGGGGTAGAQAGGAGGQTLPDAGPEAPSPSDGGGGTGSDARDAADAPSGTDAPAATDGGRDAGTDALTDRASPPDVGRASPGLHVLAGALGGAGRADDVGADARFNGLNGLAWDGAGNLYVGDNYAIRKIVLATGAVTTVAGVLGTSGFANGVGATARFTGPGQIAWDGAGNLYVGDNDVIRKVVVATGAVSTVAGSPGQFMVVDGVGAQARFWYPEGIAVDGAGNLYVSDAGGGTIRRLVLATGEVTTIAGAAGTVGSVDGTGSAARFDSPDHLALDGAGNLYVADRLNATIRKVALASGEVTTIAGAAGMHGSADGAGTSARLAEPDGLVFDGAGNLFFSDRGNTAVRKITLATSAVTTVAGSWGMSGSTDGVGPAARFALPVGLASDGAGNLYVSDADSYAVRKIVLATASVTTVAGSASKRGSTDGAGAAARFSTPLRVAEDGAGNLFVASDFAIRKVALPGGEVTTFAGDSGTYGTTDGRGTAARFRTIRGLVSDKAGTLYVADSGNYTIRKVDLGTGMVTTIAGTAQMPGSADGTGATARFDNPYGLALDGGNLYVADSTASTLRKVDLATRAVTTFAGAYREARTVDAAGTDARFYFPEDLTAAGDGNFYVADTGSNIIRRVVIATAQVTTLAGLANISGGTTDGVGGAARFASPRAITADGAGNLYAADLAGPTIRKVVTATGAVTTVIGVPGRLGAKEGPLPAALNQPIGLAFLYTGDLAIVDAAENAVLIAGF
jgi:sugar lactone lactonase YvrE